MLDLELKFQTLFYIERMRIYTADWKSYAPENGFKVPVLPENSPTEKYWSEIPVQVRIMVEDGLV